MKKGKWVQNIIKTEGQGLIFASIVCQSPVQQPKKIRVEETIPFCTISQMNMENKKNQITHECN